MTWNLRGRGLGGPHGRGHPELTRPAPRRSRVRAQRLPGSRAGALHGRGHRELTRPPPDDPGGGPRGYPAADFGPKKFCGRRPPLSLRHGRGQGPRRGPEVESTALTSRALGGPFLQLLPGPGPRTEHPRRGGPLPPPGRPSKSRPRPRSSTGAQKDGPTPHSKCPPSVGGPAGPVSTDKSRQHGLTLNSS